MNKIESKYKKVNKLIDNGINLRNVQSELLIFLNELSAIDSESYINNQKICYDSRNILNILSRSDDSIDIKITESSDAIKFYNYLLEYREDGLNDNDKNFFKVNELDKIIDIYNRAKGGDPIHQNNIGMIYYNGNGMPQNFEEALTWFKLAYDQGNTSATNNLGVLYYYRREYDEAIKYYNMAIQSDSIIAQGNLGQMHEYGEGFEQDYNKAFYLYVNAAQHGDPRSQKKLVWMYAYGKGVEKDSEGIERWSNKLVNNEVMELFKDNLDSMNIRNNSPISDKLI